MMQTKEEYEAAFNEGYEEATAWKPISSAPKDGTDFLGWDPIAEACALLRWDDGWVMSWELRTNEDCTHWQPIPKAPTD